ncbi:hypothetical protein pb186bvf_017628 [Paramecium bursaria]
MGSCYMRNCRCICQQNRISCQCGSQNTLLLEHRREEQQRERTNQQMSRSNRFKSMQKQNSQKKSQSKDSQDSMSKTKNSTNRRGNNSRSPQSIERQLMSDMCNLLSEQQEYKKKKIIVKIMDFPMKSKYFQEDLNQNGVQSQQFLPQQQQSSTENRATLEYIQSIKESLNKVKSESNTQKADSKVSLAQSASIAQNLESPDKLSKPLTSVSVDNQPGSISQQTLLQINQVINRSKTAQDHIDESEQKSVTPRGVLKKAPDSDGSYRSVQIQQKNRKVRFDLPNSHYAKERARQQQHFYH